MGVAIYILTGSQKANLRLSLNEEQEEWTKKEIQLFRETLSEKNRYFKRQNRKVIWDMINIHCS